MKCKDPECLTGDHGEDWRCAGHKTVRDPETGKKVPCRGNRIRGGTTCTAHGGAAPQVKKSARQRLLDMVDPVLGQMARMLDEVEKKNLWLHPSAQRLWTTVLDRTGFGVGMKLEVEDSRESSAWAQYATAEERKTLVGIMEKCRKRMDAAG